MNDPEFYVYNDPFPNAVCLGVDKPFIAMSSGLYELADEDERRAVIGHEMGHAMSGHALYQSMLMHLLNLAALFGWVPAAGLGLRAVMRRCANGSARLIFRATEPDYSLRKTLTSCFGWR